MSSDMTREENIDYLYLRAEECLFPDEILISVKTKLENTEMEYLEQLKRISEKEFRTWCQSDLKKEDKKYD